MAVILRVNSILGYKKSVYVWPEGLCHIIYLMFRGYSYVSGSAGRWMVKNFGRYEVPK